MCTFLSAHELVLEVFQALTSNTQIVKESIQKGESGNVVCTCNNNSISLLPYLCNLTGALIYLLDLFCNSQNPSVREQTAALFAKMITDKLVGPKVRIVLSKFLPLIFMDAMRDSPEASVHMFESKSLSLFPSYTVNEVGTNVQTHRRILNSYGMTRLEKKFLEL